MRRCEKGRFDLPLGRKKKKKEKKKNASWFLSSTNDINGDQPHHHGVAEEERKKMRAGPSFSEPFFSFFPTVKSTHPRTSYLQVSEKPQLRNTRPLHPSSTHLHANTSTTTAGRTPSAPSFVSFSTPFSLLQIQRTHKPKKQKKKQKDKEKRKTVTHLRHTEKNKQTRFPPHPLSHP